MHFPTDGSFKLMAMPKDQDQNKNESSISVDRTLESKESRLRLGLGVIWALTAGEAAALLALGNRPTVFLANLSVVCLSFAILVLISDFRDRVLLGPPDPPAEAPLRPDSTFIKFVESFKPLERFIDWVRPDIALPLFLIAGAWLCSLFSFAQVHARPAFYTAAAGIYPVLLIAMLLEIKDAVEKA